LHLAGIRNPHLAYLVMNHIITATLVLLARLAMVLLNEISVAI
jgi:hypothetical protein